jgi:hypothetical protein
MTAITINPVPKFMKGTKNAIIGIVRNIPAACLLLFLRTSESRIECWLSDSTCYLTTYILALMASNYLYKYGRLDSREPAEDDSLNPSSSSYHYYAPSMPSSNSGVKSAASNGKPYLGLTGTGLNIWITVACTTAMALFGKLSHESILHC